MTERRMCQRIESSHPILYRKSLSPEATLGSTMNLSSGGIKIQSFYGLTKGEGLNMAIFFSADSRVIGCKGRVKYILSSENGKTVAGIQFEELLARDKLNLLQILSHLKGSASISIKCKS